MAVGTSDDVYDDPDNILASEDDAVAGVGALPDDESHDPSQSVYLPEKDMGIAGEDRGSIDELGDFNDPAIIDDVDDELGDEPGTEGAAGSSEDVDASRLSGAVSPDERDGTDPA